MHFDIIRRWKETTEGECNSARYGFIVNAARRYNRRNA